MEERLKTLKNEIQTSLAQIEDKDSLEAIRVKYLGRKGEINQLFKQIARLSSEERKTDDNKINKLKQKLTNELNARFERFKEKPRSKIEPLLPGKVPHIGHFHPLSK